MGAALGRTINQQVQVPGAQRLLRVAQGPLPKSQSRQGGLFSKPAQQLGHEGPHRIHRRDGEGAPGLLGVKFRPLLPQPSHLRQGAA